MAVVSLFVLLLSGSLSLSAVIPPGSQKATVSIDAPSTTSSVPAYTAIGHILAPTEAPDSSFFKVADLDYATVPPLRKSMDWFSLINAGQKLGLGKALPTGIVIKKRLDHPDVEDEAQEGDFFQTFEEELQQRLESCSDLERDCQRNVKNRLPWSLQQDPAKYRQRIPLCKYAEECRLEIEQIRKAGSFKKWRQTPEFKNRHQKANFKLTPQEGFALCHEQQRLCETMNKHYAGLVPSVDCVDTERCLATMNITAPVRLNQRSEDDDKMLPEEGKEFCRHQEQLCTMITRTNPGYEAPAFCAHVDRCRDLSDITSPWMLEQISSNLNVLRPRAEPLINTTIKASCNTMETECDEAKEQNQHIEEHAAASGAGFSRNDIMWINNGKGYCQYQEQQCRTVVGTNPGSKRPASCDDIRSRCRDWKDYIENWMANQQNSSEDLQRRAEPSLDNIVNLEYNSTESEYEEVQENQQAESQQLDENAASEAFLSPSQNDLMWIKDWNRYCDYQEQLCHTIIRTDPGYKRPAFCDDIVDRCREYKDYTQNWMENGQSNTPSDLERRAELAFNTTKPNCDWVRAKCNDVQKHRNAGDVQAAARAKALCNYAPECYQLAGIVPTNDGKIPNCHWVQANCKALKEAQLKGHSRVAIDFGRICTFTECIADDTKHLRVRAEETPEVSAPFTTTPSATLSIARPTLPHALMTARSHGPALVDNNDLNDTASDTMDAPQEAINITTAEMPFASSNTTDMESNSTAESQSLNLSFLRDMAQIFRRAPDDEDSEYVGALSGKATEHSWTFELEEWKSDSLTMKWCGAVVRDCHISLTLIDNYQHNEYPGIPELCEFADRCQTIMAHFKAIHDPDWRHPMPDIQRENNMTEVNGAMIANQHFNCTMIQADCDNGHRIIDTYKLLYYPPLDPVCNAATKCWNDKKAYEQKVEMMWDISTVEKELEAVREYGTQEDLETAYRALRQDDIEDEEEKAKILEVLDIAGQ